MSSDPAELDHERRIQRLQEARVSMEHELRALFEPVCVREPADERSDRHERWKARMEQLLSEIGEKLNRLIGDPQNPQA